MKSKNQNLKKHLNPKAFKHEKHSLFCKKKFTKALIQAFKFGIISIRILQSKNPAKALIQGHFIYSFND